MDRLPMKRRRRVVPVPKMRVADAAQGKYNGGVFTQDTPGAGVVPSSKKSKLALAKKLEANETSGRLIMDI